MFRSRWRAVVAWNKFENRTKLFVDPIPMGERFTMLERNPGACRKLEGGHEIAAEIHALVFSITTLNLLMQFLLHLTLQDTSPSRLIETSSFQNVCRIDPVVMATAHDMFLEVESELELVDGDLRKSEISPTMAQDSNEVCKQGMRLTLLYVALYTPGPAAPFTILPSDICWRLSGSAMRDRSEPIGVQ